MSDNSLTIYGYEIIMSIQVENPIVIKYDGFMHTIGDAVDSLVERKNQKDSDKQKDFDNIIKLLKLAIKYNGELSSFHYEEDLVLFQLLFGNIDDLERFVHESECMFS